MKWLEVILGTLLSLEYGSALRESDRDSQGRFPVAGSNGVVGYHSKALVQGPGIVVGRKGSVGEVTWFNEDFWPIDTTYYVRLLKPSDLRWAYYLLKFLNLGSLSIITGVPGLNRNDAYNLKVQVPTISEQRRIVEILDQADVVRKKRSDADTKAARILPALFYKMFGDPATNPKGWATTNLDEVADIGTQLVDPNDPKFLDLPHIGGEQIEKDTGRILSPKLVRDSDLRSGKFHFTSDHILYSKIRPYLNKVAYPRFNGVCSADIYPIRPIDGRVSHWYLIALLRSPAFLAYARIHSERLRMAKLNREQLGAFTTPLPSPTALEIFENQAKQIELLEKARFEQTDRVTTLFNVLLHRAFRSELTAKWRETHMEELLTEMEAQARILKASAEAN